jgi:hypothetical protein
VLGGDLSEVALRHLLGHLLGAPPPSPSKERSIKPLLPPRESELRGKDE